MSNSYEYLKRCYNLPILPYNKWAFITPSFSACNCCCVVISDSKDYIEVRSPSGAYLSFPICYDCAVREDLIEE